MQRWIECGACYSRPFDDLGKNDLVRAGFEETHFREILADPEIPKFVHRVSGEATCLCFLATDFEKAPWFNRDYYVKNGPEYLETDNFFIFPGIVSDVEKRGNRYAATVLELVCKLFVLRGSSFGMTFECTQISTQYIPRMVSQTLHAIGATPNGLDRPAARIDYYAISPRRR